MSEDIHYLQKIRDISRLRPYIKQGVVSTGRQLGKGAFGYVVELQLYGAVCAGKKIHETFVRVVFFKREGPLRAEGGL